MPSRRRKPVCLQMGQVGSRDFWSMVPQCRQTHGEDGVGGAGCGVRGSGAGVSSATLSGGCRWSGARPRRRSDSGGAWLGEWSSAMAYARAITAPSGRAAAGRTSGRSSQRRSRWPGHIAPPTARPWRVPTCTCRACSWSRGERRCGDEGDATRTRLPGCVEASGRWDGGSVRELVPTLQGSPVISLRLVKVSSQPSGC